MIAVLVVLGIACAAWLGFELWRAPVCCNRCEMPLEQCCCSRFRKDDVLARVQRKTGGEQ